MMVVIIPALNEENTIRSVVKQAINYFPVIVVDDGSADKTSQIASDSGATVVRLERNKGVDFALAKGFETAIEMGFKAVITIDADGQHDPILIPRIAEPVLSDVSDICHSCRDSYQRWSEKILRAYSKRMHGFGDILSGLKAFRLDIYNLDPHLVKKDTLGTAVPWLAHKSNLRISEIEIMTYERADKPRIGGFLIANYRIFKALARLIFWDLTSFRSKKIINDISKID